MTGDGANLEMVLLLRPRPADRFLTLKSNVIALVLVISISPSIVASSSALRSDTAPARNVKGLPGATKAKFVKGVAKSSV